MRTAYPVDAIWRALLSRNVAGASPPQQREVTGHPCRLPAHAFPTAAADEKNSTVAGHTRGL